MIFLSDYINALTHSSMMSVGFDRIPVMTKVKLTRKNWSGMTAKGEKCKRLRYMLYAYILNIFKYITVLSWLHFFSKKKNHTWENCCLCVTPYRSGEAGRKPRKLGYEKLLEKFLPCTVAKVVLPNHYLVLRTWKL